MGLPNEINVKLISPVPEHHVTVVEGDTEVNNQSPHFLARK